MTTTDYDNTPFEEHHKPTGIRLVRPEPVSHTWPQNPWTLRSGPGADWAAEIEMTYVRAERRARALGTTYEGLRDDERFRREFGDLSTLYRAVPVGPGEPVPWDAALVDMHDVGGFRRGEPAYPDRMELKAPELPADLRGTVVANRYAPASP